MQTVDEKRRGSEVKGVHVHMWVSSSECSSAFWVSKEFFNFFLGKKHVANHHHQPKVYTNVHTQTHMPATLLWAVVRIQQLPFHPWTESVKQREPEPIRGLFCIAVCIKEKSPQKGWTHLAAPLKSPAETMRYCQQRVCVCCVWESVREYCQTSALITSCKLGQR